MTKPHYVILGAGITGLALGWFLKQRLGSSARLTILEKENRTGGWIETRHTQGFLFEQGPRSCHRAGTGIETLKLIESLGLQSQVIVPAPAAKRRFLYIDQKLQPIPHRLISLITSPLTRVLVSKLWQEWRTPKGTESDESIYEFISRRLSPQIAERFFDPLTSGIYAGDIRRLSMKSCFPLLYECEQNHGSILKGMLRKKKNKITHSPFTQEICKHPLFSFRNGMETLTRELTHRLSEHLSMECQIKALHFAPNTIHVETKDGKEIQADHLFSTLPTYGLAKIVNEPFAEQLKIAYASVAVVNLGWHKKVLQHEGFGYLVPTQENEDILGVVWDSCVFPQQNEGMQTRLTVMIGGTHKKNFALYSEKELIEIAKKALLRHLQIDIPPDGLSFKMAQQAIPQYLIGHAETTNAIHAALSNFTPRMTLLGSFHGVSVNDCISQALRVSKHPEETCFGKDTGWI